MKQGPFSFRACVDPHVHTQGHLYQNSLSHSLFISYQSVQLLTNPQYPEKELYTSTRYHQVYMKNLSGAICVSKYGEMEFHRLCSPEQ